MHSDGFELTRPGSADERFLAEFKGSPRVAIRWTGKYGPIMLVVHNGPHRATSVIQGPAVDGDIVDR